MKTLILILLLGLTLQSCTKGCLKCTSENKCTLCDTTAFYKTNVDTCALADQPNCNSINLLGECLSCKGNYWLNSTTKKCVVVETDKKVTNCVAYTSTQTCAACEPHFVIEAAKCKAVATQLVNCETYGTETTCGGCKSGFFVSSDLKSCETAPSVSNCNQLSRFECQTCESGFILNRNLYFNTSFKTSSTLEKMSTLLSISFQNNNLKLLNNSISVCQTTTATNCLEFETFNTCKLCKDEFFLKEDKTCEAYPKSIIDNCQIYTSDTVCQTCNQGFYRVSSTECKLVTSVENCSEYSQDSNTTACKKCNAEYYVASTTSCAARVISAGSLIANCKTKYHNADKCEFCNTSFQLSSGEDECAPMLPDCLKHNDFPKGTTPTCSTCINGYYLSNNVCTTGSDSNCVVYNNDGTCKTCKNKWFHNNTCTEHVDIGNCDVYHNTLKNSCLTCGNNTYNFEVEKQCRDLAVISNCKTYNHDKTSSSVTAASCLVCEDEYYLTSSSKCDRITVGNCKTGTSVSVCTNCVEGFVLFDTAGTLDCRKPHDYMIDQCAEVENTGDVKTLKDVTCKNCKINAFMVDYSDSYVCVKDDMLKDANTLELDTNTNALISGCIKYTSKTDCAMCASDKYLAADFHTCSDDCGGNPFSVFKLIGTPSGAVTHQYVDNANVCKPADTNIAMYSWANDFTEIPVKCKADKVTVVAGAMNAAVRTSNVNLDGLFGDWFPNLKNLVPEVDCATPTSINGTATAVLITYCDYYKLDSASAYFCVRCKFGYHGKSDSGGDYIESCESMSTCSEKVEYGNLLGNFSEYFSCHKCSDEKKIPYFLYEMDATATDTNVTGFAQYSLDASKDYNDASENHTIECLDNSTKAKFKEDVGSTYDTFDLVDSCGLGLFNLKDLTTKDGAFEILCAACKPGYAPGTANAPVALAASPKLGTVTACYEIPNCTGKDWFNACSSCATDHVYEVKANGNINYSKCIAQKDSNCFATKLANKNCVYCKKGYVLNNDGVCVVLDTPRCQAGKYTPYTTMLAASTGNSEYLYWYSEQGAGCNQCDAGYTSIKNHADFFTSDSCALSSWISANATDFKKQKTDDLASKYINYCESYVVGESPQSKCAKCNANYVLRFNQLECVIVANCLVASNSGSTCKTCKPGFGLANFICAAGNTPNCATYNTNSSNPIVSCTKCNEGFYKTSSDQCLPGTVAHCKTHGSTPEDCSECKDGYFLIKDSFLSASNNAHDYCFKIDSSLKCKTADVANSSIGGKITCKTCIVDHSVIEAPALTAAQTSCFAFNPIENCETYNQGNTLALSTLLCTKCKKGYYLSEDGFLCLKRTVNPINCKDHEPAQDLCSLCNETYFLKSDKKECIKFPSGVINCRTYSDALTCTACKTDTWLNENTCTPITAEAKVTSCKYYSNALVCSECQENFFLEGNTCVSLTVSNCATVASKDACETCKPGNRLKTDNGKTTCENFTKPNCITYEESGTNPCTLCNQNHYINADGNCTTVTAIISHCLVNESVETCKLCAAGFALSKDKKSCVNASVFDTNCASVVMPDNMSCGKCDGGYYFKNNVCTAFTGKTFVDGCFSQDLEDDKVCLVCNTGYYMNSSLNCVKNVIDDVSDDTELSDGFEIVRGLVAMILTLVFMF